MEDKSYQKKDSKGKRRKKVDLIRDHRDKEKVIDILKLKLKYLVKEDV